MPKRPQKPQDSNQLAASIVAQATGQTPAKKAKNPHAVALGRLGGLKGGRVRAEKLNQKQRREIARKAARSRWAK